jgi:hypothetical protein
VSADDLIARLRRLVSALVLIFTSTVALDVAAHEIPADVKLNAFLKPAGNRLELLIRVPMAVLVEVEFPLRGPGYIELNRVDALAALGPITNRQHHRLRERCALPTPRVVETRAFRCHPTNHSRHLTVRVRM